MFTSKTSATNSNNFVLKLFIARRVSKSFPNLSIFKINL